MAKKRKRVAVLIQADWLPCKNSGATAVTRLWAESAEQKLIQSGLFEEVILLRGPDANQPSVRNRLARIRKYSGLVIFYGHGCINGGCLYQSQYEPRTSLRSAVGWNSCELLQNKIVYVVACHSAKPGGLGPLSVRSGAICYIGYEDSITTGPQQGYMEAANAGIDVLLQRHGTCLDAWKAIRDGYRTWYRLYRSRSAFRDVALALFVNLDALAYPLGNRTARL